MNPVKGEVPLTLSDGREFILVMDFEALVEAEGAAGQPLPNLMAQASLGFVGAQRSLLFGALRRHHSGVTLAECSEIMLSEINAAAPALTAAIEAAFPEAKEGKDGKNPPGKTSGANGAKPDSTRKPSGKSRRPRSGSSSAHA